MVWACVREVLSSNLSLIPATPTEGFHSFPQSLQENSGTVPRLGYDHFLPSLFQLSTHSSFYEYHETVHNLGTYRVIK
jgi:hypothetical protein